MKNISLIIYLLILTNSCNLNSDRNRISENNTIKYNRIGGKDTWGYKDSNGKNIIALGKYKFLNPIDEKGMILAQLKDKWGYIDINEKILIPFEYDDLGVFSQELAPAKKNGKFGYINRLGNVVISFQFENKSYFYRCGLTKVKIADKWGFINKNGESIIPIKFHKADYNSVDSIVIVSKNEKWAFFNYDGVQLTDFSFDEIVETSNINDEHTFIGNGLVLVRKNKEYGFFDKKLKKVIDFGYYSWAEPINEYGFSIVLKDSLYGIINSKGELVVPTEYTSIEHPKSYSHNYGEFYVCKNKKYGLLDVNAKFVTQIAFDEFTHDFSKIGDSVETVFITRNQDKYGVFNANGKTILPIEFDEIQFFEGDSITPAKKEGKYGLIGSNGKTILPFENKNIIKDKDRSYYIVNREGIYGIVNKKSLGIEFPYKYENIKPCFYDEKNRFIVKKNRRWGIITKNQDVIIPIDYDSISNWVEYGPEAHFVIKNGKHGLIAREGKILIPTIYEELFYITDEVIKVRKNNKYGLINISHSIILPFEFDEIFLDWYSINMIGETLKEIYVKKDDRYSIVDMKGNTIRKDIPEKEVAEKFRYDFEQKNENK